jgi:hypothetical protein
MALELPFEELVNIVNTTKLTYNPLDDMYKIMKLDDMIYNTNKYQQWKESSCLYEFIVAELEKNIPDFIYSQEELNDKIKSFVEKNVYPIGTKNDLLDYFRDIYVNQTGFNYSTITSEEILNGEKYLDFMSSLRYVIDKVYSTYIYIWGEIDAKYNKLYDLIEEKFGHLEVQEEYLDFTKNIFRLMDEVDELVKPFYKYNKDYINKGYLERDYNMCFNIVMTKNGVDHSTEELLRSTVYLTNMELHKLSLDVKITQEKLSNLVF